MKPKVRFFLGNESCLSLQVKKHLIYATFYIFLPLLDCDLLFMNAPDQYLKSFDTALAIGNHLHHCYLFAAK